MKLPSVCLVTCLALAAPTAWCAPDAPASRPAEKTVKIGQVRVNLAKRQVAFDAEVCLREGVLEFMIVEWKTKTHESLLHTQAKSSHVHAGLLMLGLTQGKPARWAGQELGAMFLPPAGAGVSMEFQWTGSDGKVHSMPAGKWLAGPEGQQIEAPDRWIFVGSDILPDGRYWAEVDGEMVSLTNFASAVLDVPFRSSSANAERGFYAAVNEIPPVGTKVRVVLTPLPGAERVPDARATVEIDRFGNRRVEGKIKTVDQLERWASQYILAHDRGMVVVRAHGLACVWDIAATQSVLRLGGVREFNVQRVRPGRQLLPRSRDQAAGELSKWKQKFRDYRDLLEDPGVGAGRTLAQIERELADIEARRELLKDYAGQLKKALAKYQATTQPAGAGGAGQ